MHIELNDALVRPAVVTALCDQIVRLDEQGSVTAARALRQIAQQIDAALAAEGAPVREHLEGAADADT